MDTPAEVKNDYVKNVFKQRTGSNNNAEYENFISQSKKKEQKQQL